MENNYCTKFLKYHFDIEDNGFMLLSLTDYIRTDRDKVIEVLKDEPYWESFNEVEMFKLALILTVFITLTEHVESWMLNDLFRLDKPYYVDKKLDDFSKVKLMLLSGTACKYYNVYIDKSGLGRV